jgi:hypothetical protein
MSGKHLYRTFLIVEAFFELAALEFGCVLQEVPVKLQLTVQTQTLFVLYLRTVNTLGGYCLFNCKKQWSAQSPQAQPAKTLVHGENIYILLYVYRYIYMRSLCGGFWIPSCHFIGWLVRRAVQCWNDEQLTPRMSPRQKQQQLTRCTRHTAEVRRVFSRMSKVQRAKKPRLSADVTAREFAELGAEFMHRDPDGNKRDFDSRWQAHFCAEPEVCADVWMRLDVDATDPDAPDDKIAEPCHLLWALLLLKTYDTESVLAGLCGGVDEDTFRKWAWHFIEKVSYLEHEVVSCFIFMLDMLLWC